MYKNWISKFLMLITLYMGVCCSVHATNYTVSTESSLITTMNNAYPGDTINVANGTYDWGQITLTNTNSTSTSNWIVLKAQTFNRVIFTGSTYLQFSGTRIMVSGFRFASGSVGTTSVIQFRNSAYVAANYCRLNNITIDNYNSDSSANANPANPGVGIDNKWVSIFGTNNRVDHCTFINKFNAGATLVVWYDQINGPYPGQSTSTYHRIDSNYFNGRGYLGGNRGESIRVGTGEVSRSFGYNTVEYNLFENMVQTEPEIISNKTCFNTYRYNTFKNCRGGLTLRTARFCKVYSNFFIVDNPAVINAYGIRIIDKGHKVFNNYIEGVNGNSGSLTSLRCPIILYNGQYPINDTLNPDNSGGYWSADSSVVAFNTIVNCKGGAGITIAHTDNNTLPYQPLGLVIANNVIKMTTGQAAYKDPYSTTATYFAEGNIYSAPYGLGLPIATGFTSATLNFGARQNGILTAPSQVQDAAANSAAYTALLNTADAQGQARSAVYDIGADEVNGTGPVLTYPLDNTLVGAGTPSTPILPVYLVSFNASVINKQVLLQWKVANEINFKQYELEYSVDGITYQNIAVLSAVNQSVYSYQYNHTVNQKEFYRLKLVNNNGSFSYSNIVRLLPIGKFSVSVYPNPAREYISIAINGTANKQTEIILFDALGGQVKSITTTNNNNRISVQNLTKGLYHIQIKQRDGEAVFYPFVIQ